MRWFRSKSIELPDEELENLGFLLVDFRLSDDGSHVDPTFADLFHSLDLRLDNKSFLRIFPGKYFVIPCLPGKYKIHAQNRPFFLTDSQTIEIGKGEFIRIAIEHISYSTLFSLVFFFVKPHWVTGATLSAYIHPIIVLDYLIWRLVPRFFRWRKIWLTSHRLWPEERGTMTNEIASLHLRRVPSYRHTRPSP